MPPRYVTSKPRSHLPANETTFALFYRMLGNITRVLSTGGGGGGGNQILELPPPISLIRSCIGILHMWQWFPIKNDLDRFQCPHANV